MRIDRERALGWSVDEVLERWTVLFSGPLLVRRYLSEQRSGMLPAEIETVLETAEVYRTRLYDLSWFMRTLNEDIARRANAEDGVKGRFWEGRFKSQALLDEPALLAALAYVDLNPIRAGIAETPETSDYTSIQERIRELARKDAAPQPGVDSGAVAARAGIAAFHPGTLMPFDATGRASWAIPFDFKDYLEMVDWTGRAVRPDKRGSIPESTPRLLARLGIDRNGYIEYGARMLKVFGTAVGAPEAMVNLCAKRQSRYLWGLRAARRLFPDNRIAA